MRSTAIESVVVVVPACNEQDLIGGCLDAVDVAVRHLHDVRPAIDVESLVVLDACNDQTAARVLAHPGVGAVTCNLRCVGAARALAVAHMLDRVARPGTVWIARTGAHSRGPPHGGASIVRV